MDIVGSSAQHLTAIERIERQTQFSPWSTEEFKRSIESPNRRAWTALIDNTVIGYAVFNVLGGEAELLTVSISPDVQGQGLGRLLLESTLKQLDCETIFLEVRLSNVNARGLYEALGFNEVGQRADYYPAAQGREDAVIYALDLGLPSSM